MKRNFVAGLFGGVIGSITLFILLSAVGLVGAQGRSDVGDNKDRSTSAVVQSIATTAVTSTFNYQGQLKSNGNPVSATCAMTFTLYDASSAGNVIGTPMNNINVAVNNGYFTQLLDFGSNVFNGTARWLEIGLNCGSGFASLSRQLIAAVPYASFSLSTGALQGNAISTTAPGTGQVLKWNGSSWSPAADAGGTSYTAGFGLALNGSQFNAVTSTLQQRVIGSCSIGQYVRSIDANGNVVCGTDANSGGTITNVTAGFGLTGGGSIGSVALNVVTTSVQSRVNGNCSVGNAIRAINADGTVTCQATSSGGSFWSLSGNSGTSSVTNFVGTTDNVSLTLRVSNTVAYRLMPASGTNTPNVIGGSAANNVAPGLYGATIAGGGANFSQNVISGTANYAVIGGGDNNYAYGLASTIAGGGYNQANADGTTIGGGQGNVANINLATIGGGYQNTVNGGQSTIGGGQNNTTAGSASTVSGGAYNTAGAAGAFVGGGGYDGSGVSGNQALAVASTIGGGVGNTTSSSAPYAFIGGGITNTTYSTSTVIGGGSHNTISITSTYGTIAGGDYNTVAGYASTIGGGTSNVAINAQATVAGGASNVANGSSSAVGGGLNNTASGNESTVGGGYDNTASGIGAFIGGGGFDGANIAGNQALANASTIGGGLNNLIVVTATDSIIGGGISNTIHGQYSVIGGGVSNTINANFITYATIGGGYRNTTGDQAATVSGGANNTASGYLSAIGGGNFNTASNSAATVGGGIGNAVSGYAATIPGGYQNMAQGAYSLAAGYYALALHDGAFVWADDSSNTPFTSTASNQFLVRADGGVAIGTNDPNSYALNVQRNGGTAQYQVAKFKNAATSGDRTAIVDIENGDASPTLWRFSVGGTGNGIGYTNGQFYLERAGAGAAMVIDANRNMTLTPSSGSCVLASGAGWSCSSDRNLKENFVSVNTADVLAKVAQLPITTWNLKGDAVTHVGPMAQDFYAAFNVGEDDKHINTVDAQGVALAAIQGLYQENQDLKTQNANLEARVSQLEQDRSPEPQFNFFNLIGVVALIGVAGMWLQQQRQRKNVSR